MRSSLGSLKAAWIWLVKAPGVKRPAIEEYPTYLLENSPLSLGSAGDNEHIQRILNL